MISLMYKYQRHMDCALMIKAKSRNSSKAGATFLFVSESRARCSTDLFYQKQLQKITNAISLG